MSKKETKRFTITVNQEIIEKLQKGNYNKNKLINNLLKDYLEKKEK